MFSTMHNTINDLDYVLEKIKENLFQKFNNQISIMDSKITDLSPSNILKKGYCLLLDPDGNIIDNTNILNALSNMDLKIIFSNGTTNIKLKNISN